MSSQTLGLIIGGGIPALMFATSGLFAKAAFQQGIGLGVYMMILGSAVVIVGLGIHLFFADGTFSFAAGSKTFVAGFSWGIGAAGIGLALSKFGIPIGKLAPVYNFNTVIVVLLALWIFAEWKEVHTVKLLVGTVLATIGTTLVTQA